MFTIQFLDHEEGSGARWNEVSNSRRDTRAQARELLKKIRANYNEHSTYYGDVEMYSYRIVEVDSKEFYSQPTDCLEY